MTPISAAERARQYRLKVRAEVIAAYGGKCVCCGEETPEFLTIDHIHGRGNIHRQVLFGSKRVGSKFYSWLKQAGFPEWFQLLCANCNQAKGVGKTCPHQRKERDEIRMCPYERVFGISVGVRRWD